MTINIPRCTARETSLRVMQRVDEEGEVVVDHNDDHGTEQLMPPTLRNRER
tara:strand:+ start:298 stop:450 length:153 start_codon:yes stop_codon:yes gene_type:complete